MIGDRHLRRGLLAVLVLTACTRSAPAPPPPSSEPQPGPRIRAERPRLGPRECPDFAAVFEQVSRGVVAIHIPDPDDPTGRHPLRIGSGFFIDAEGTVLTNAHVVADSDLLRVRLWNNQQYSAHVMGLDRFTDLALVRLKSPPAVTPLVLGNSDRVRVGEWVMAIGTPFGLSHTVTVGVVSARHRRRVFMSGAEQYTNFIQTDAQINPGSSGGPLLNARGEVIGISTALQENAPGIGFALPINVAQALMPLLKRGAAASRLWLGVVWPPDARREYPSGIPIVDVLQGSAAWRSGLRPGDVVVSFNGRPLSRIPDLRLLLTAMSLGGSMKLEVRRGNKMFFARILLLGPKKDGTRPPKTTGTPPRKKKVRR